MARRRRRPRRPRQRGQAPGGSRLPFLLRYRWLYASPVVPIIGIVVVVVGVLGVVLFLRGSTGAPRVGDHWHAAYSVFIGSQRLAPIPTSEPEGVGTHGDGVIHLHPFTPAGAGSGAALGKMFERMGGELTATELQYPGDNKVYKDGDPINGQPGTLRILRARSGLPNPVNVGQMVGICDGLEESRFEKVGPRYVPQDGDCIRIQFGPTGPPPAATPSPVSPSPTPSP